MLDRMVEKAREQKVFSREDTSTERRVLGAFFYHAGLSDRRIESFGDRSHEAVRQWFHRGEHLFEPDCQDRQQVAVDETKVEGDGEEVYVWAALNCESLEVLHIDVSPGRPSLDHWYSCEKCSRRAAVARSCGPTGAPGTTGRWNC